VTDLSVGKVQHLPDPVDAIDLGVVQEEGGVTGADEGVGAGVATDDEVAATVDAQVTEDVAGIALLLIRKGNG